MPKLINRDWALTTGTALTGSTRLRNTSESTTRPSRVSRTNTSKPAAAVVTATDTVLPHAPGLAAEMTSAFFALPPPPSLMFRVAAVSPVSVIRTIQATPPPCRKYCSTP